MKITFKSTLSSFLISLSLVACSTNLGVNEVFKNRNNLAGKSIVVEGYILNKGLIYNLCETTSDENCIILEYKNEYKKFLKNSVGMRVLANGVYLEHDYVETNNGLNFIPSRLSISSFELAGK